jgi:L-threonylcarbamoyladenylate synthase
MSVSDHTAIEKGAKLIKSGALVAIPTETVYGLAANALDEQAVKHIFSVKGRPQDNPLIVHTYDINNIVDIAAEIPPLARKLFEVFSPGPLTIVLPKNKNIPSVTSGGLDTVGIRIPAIPAVRELIKLAGVPLAAPSANLSGLPSPTTADHVYSDLNGKIPLILDGGACNVGVESTVITVTGAQRVNILRPGAVTAEKLFEYCEVTVDSGVTEGMTDDITPASPGMKYKHYAPKADITLIEGDLSGFVRYFSSHADNDTYALLFDNDKISSAIPENRQIFYGSNGAEQAARLFAVLRQMDETGIKKVYARCPEKTGEGLAVYNRLLRAAGFKKFSVF